MARILKEVLATDEEIEKAIEKILEEKTAVVIGPLQLTAKAFDSFVTPESLAKFGIIDANQEDIISGLQLFAKTNNDWVIDIESRGVPEKIFCFIRTRG